MSFPRRWESNKYVEIPVGIYPRVDGDLTLGMTLKRQDSHAGVYSRGACPREGRGREPLIRDDALFFTSVSGI